MADADNLEDALRQIVAVDGTRDMHEAWSDHRDDVAPTCELGGLAVHVFRNPAELRVVVVADDRDPQSGATVRGPT